MGSSRILPLAMAARADSPVPCIEGDGRGRFEVSGELILDTVPRLWETAQRLFVDVDDLVIDLGGVSRCDSAGAALVVDWATSRRLAGRSFKVSRLPEQMRAILRVSDLEQLVLGEETGA